MNLDAIAAAIDALGERKRTFDWPAIPAIFDVRSLVPPFTEVIAKSYLGDSGAYLPHLDPPRYHGRMAGVLTVSGAADFTVRVRPGSWVCFDPGDLHWVTESEELRRILFCSAPRNEGAQT